MPEYNNPDGTLAYGYYCYRCGKTTNMVGTGHGEEECSSNPKLIQALELANPLPGKKPHFVCKS